MRLRISISMIVLTCLITELGCKKLVEVAPPITSVNGESVFKEDVTASAVLTGIYTNMSNTLINQTSMGWLTNVCFTTGLTGDELMLFDISNTGFASYLNNSLSPQEFSTWANVYKMIFIANSAIEGVTKATSLTPKIKVQLLGEAKFVRAFCYFYLVNLYGDVPLALSTDYSINRFLPRASKTIVYNQIIQDLNEAKDLLSQDFISGDLVSKTSERLRPTKWAAMSMLSRTYLYTQDFSKAESEATSIINNNTLFDLVPIDDAFKKNSKESIWQLQPVGANVESNTREGQLFVLPSTGLSFSTNPVYLRPDLVASFEANDIRKTNWIKSIVNNGISFYYPNKYKVGRVNTSVVEYSTVLRLSEQYLIRAEARIHLGKTQDGIADLNRIRKRATDTAMDPAEQLKQLSSALSQIDALKAVEHERRVELFTEWGHRWFDLKRTQGFNVPSKSRADEVLSILKGVNWQTTDQLFPIPQIDITLNPNLVGHQNLGY